MTSLALFSRLSAIAYWVPGRFFSRLVLSYFCAAAKARGSNLRVHYKHMREVAHLIQGMKLSKSKQYLQVWTLRISVNFGHHDTMSMSSEQSELYPSSPGFPCIPELLPGH